MKKFIIPRGPLFVLFVVVMFLSAVQALINKKTKSDGPEVLVNATCAVQGTITTNDKVVLKLDCQGQKTIMGDLEVLASYIKNPGPLTCTVYESSKAECQPRKQ